MEFNSLPSTFYPLLSTLYSLLSILYPLLSTFYTLLSTFYTLLPPKNNPNTKPNPYPQRIRQQIIHIPGAVRHNVLQSFGAGGKK